MTDEEITGELERWGQWINAHYQDLKRHLCTWGFQNHLGFDEDAYQDALYCVTRAINNGKRIEYNEDVTHFGLLFISYKNCLYKRLNAAQRRNKVFDDNWDTNAIENAIRDMEKRPDEFDTTLDYETQLNDKVTMLHSKGIKSYIYRHMGTGAVPVYTKYLHGERLTQAEQRTMRDIKKLLKTSNYAKQEYDKLQQQDI